MATNVPKPLYDDDITPSGPPPSYSEALNSPPVLPNRPLAPPSSQPQFLSQNHSLSYNQPPMPQRPPSGYQVSSYGASGSSSTHYGESGLGTSSLYSNNPNLPFQYPRGHYCRTCLNSGYKLRNGKSCRDCWDTFYLNKHAYNPNPNLPFRYPKRYICDKCRNTGIKLKNKLTCQDCYARFAPRNNYSVTPSFNGLFGFLGIVAPISNYGPGPGPAIQVPPGDPRLGGTLCGNCRGTGQITFFLDLDLCPVCGGLGRLLNSQPPQQTGYYR